MMELELELVHRGKAMPAFLKDEPLILHRFILLSGSAPHGPSLLHGSNKIVSRILKQVFDVHESYRVPKEIKTQYLITLERILQIKQYVQGRIGLSEGNSVWQLLIQVLTELGSELDRIVTQVSKR